MGRIKLLHDNAPAHKSHLVQEYLAKENAETLPHPAYSLDLAPYDLFLFPHLKKYLARRSFKSRSALGTAVFQCLAHTPKEVYRSAFLQWIGGLEECAAVEGEYLEQLKQDFVCLLGMKHTVPSYLLVPSYTCSLSPLFAKNSLQSTLTCLRFLVEGWGPVTLREMLWVSWFALQTEWDRGGGGGCRSVEPLVWEKEDF